MLCGHNLSAEIDASVVSPTCQSFYPVNLGRSRNDRRVASHMTDCCWRRERGEASNLAVCHHRQSLRSKATPRATPKAGDRPSQQLIAAGNTVNYAALGISIIPNALERALLPRLLSPTCDTAIMRFKWISTVRGSFLQHPNRNIPSSTFAIQTDGMERDRLTQKRARMFRQTTSTRKLSS